MRLGSELRKWERPYNYNLFISQLHTRSSFSRLAIVANSTGMYVFVCVCAYECLWKFITWAHVIIIKHSNNNNSHVVGTFRLAETKIGMRTGITKTIWVSKSF